MKSVGRRRGAGQAGGSGEAPGPVLPLTFSLLHQPPPSPAHLCLLLPLLPADSLPPLLIACFSSSLSWPSLLRRVISLPLSPPISLPPASSTFWLRRNKGCPPTYPPACPPVQASQRLRSDGMFQMERRKREREKAMQQRCLYPQRSTLPTSLGSAGHQDHRGWLETHRDVPPHHHGNRLHPWPWYLRGEPLGSSQPPFPGPFQISPSGHCFPKGPEPLVQVP